MTRREWFETEEGQEYQAKRRAWKMAWKKTRKGSKTTRKGVAKKKVEAPKKKKPAMKQDTLDEEEFD